jgi:hypothetical protein
MTAERQCLHGPFALLVLLVISRLIELPVCKAQLHDLHKFKNSGKTSRVKKSLMGTESGTDTAITEKYVSRLNYGIIFRAMSILDNNENVWKHIYKIKLPAIPNLPTPIENPCHHDSWKKNVTRIVELPAPQDFDFCNIYEHSVEIYDAQSQYLYADVIKNIKDIYSLMHINLQNNTNKGIKRTKRGLLNVVGDGLKFMFGTATMNDYQKLASVVTQLDRHSEELVDNTNHMKGELLSLTQLVTKQTRLNLDQIQTNHNNTVMLAAEIKIMAKAYNALIKDCNEWKQWLMQFIHNTLTLLHQRITAFQIIQSESIELLEAFNLLNDNRLSPRLIKTNQLEELFVFIESQLQDNFQNTNTPRFFITYTDVRQVYDRPTVIHYVHDDDLYIQLSIPLNSYESVFTIYETIVIPVTINYNTSKMATELLNIPKYLGVSLDHSRFLQLSESDLQHCPIHPDNVRRCSQNLPIYSSSNFNSCIRGLWFNDRLTITQLCKTQMIFKYQIVNRFIPIGNSSYASILDITDEITGKLSCSSKQYDFKLCTYCIITIPCACQLELTKFDFSVPPSIMNCKLATKEEEIRFEFPVNLLFLSHFSYDVSYLEHFHDNNSLTAEPIIQLTPEILELSQKALATSQDQKNIIMETDKLIAKLKQRKDITFNPLGDVIEDFTTYSIFPYWFQYIYVGASIVVLLLTFLILCVMAKMANLNNLVLLLAVTSNVHTTKARVIEAPNQGQLPPPVVIQYMQFPYVEFYLIILLFSIIVIVTLFLFFKQVYSRRTSWFSPMKYFNSHAHTTDILLEFASQSASIVIPVETLVCHWSDMLITDAEIFVNNFINHGCSQKYLRVSWRNTKISIKNRMRPTSLLELIPVSWSVFNALQTIAEDPNCQIFLLYGKYGRYFTHQNALFTAMNAKPLQSDLYPQLPAY